METPGSCEARTAPSTYPATVADAVGGAGAIGPLSPWYLKRGRARYSLTMPRDASAPCEVRSAPSSYPTPVVPISPPQRWRRAVSHARREMRLSPRGCRGRRRR